MNQSLERKCDECEFVSDDLLICLTCIQTLCQDCDRRIHNKGTRIKHKRVSIRYTLYEDPSQDMVFFYFSEEIYQSRLFESNQPNQIVMKLVFDHIIDETREGNSMVSIQLLHESLRKHYDMTEESLCKILSEGQGQQFFNMTIRRFGDLPDQRYFSLRLSQISLEAIIWILKSISIDRMKPTEQLIQS